MKRNSTGKNQRRQKRQARVRAVVSGTTLRPRLNVFRSLRHVFAQLIDDTTKRTLVSVHSKKAVKGEVGDRKAKTATAFLVGLELAKKAKELNIKKAVFDRAGYQYHGRVQALAEGAREGGLEF